jgi:hypothetical protein
MGLRYNDFVKKVEKVNNGYPVEDHSIDRILFSLMFNPDLYLNNLNYTTSLINTKFSQNVGDSKYITDVLCNELFGTRTPRFDSDQYVNIQSEAEVYRTYSQLAKRWFDENYFDLSDKAINGIYRYSKKDTRPLRKVAKKIKSQIWVPNESHINNGGYFDVSELYAVRHSQKLDPFFKHVHRTSRLIQPTLEELVAVFNFPHSKNLGHTTKEEINTNLHIFQKKYCEDSLALIKGALDEGRDMIEALCDPLFIEENVPEQYNREKFVDNISRCLMGDLGRVSIITTDNVINFLPHLEKDLSDRGILKSIKEKSEDLRNTTINDTYKKDGASVFSFMGNLNEGTSTEIRFFTPQKVIEATFGKASHKDKERKDKEYIKKKERKLNSTIKVHKAQVDQVKNAHKQNYGY